MKLPLGLSFCLSRGSVSVEHKNKNKKKFREQPIYGTRRVLVIFPLISYAWDEGKKSRFNRHCYVNAHKTPEYN